MIALPAVSQRPFPVDTAAVVLGEVPQFADLQRTDGTAAQGPWSLVVRRRDGSLGRHGAVITYPVPPPAWGHPVRVGRAIGTAVAGGFVWPLAGKYARIRSDLPPPDVVRLALATTVVSAAPAIHSLSRYRIVLAAPYRSGSIHEIRYHASQLGSAAAGLDGLIYTGLLIAGGGFGQKPRNRLALKLALSTRIQQSAQSPNPIHYESSADLSADRRTGRSLLPRIAMASVNRAPFASGDINPW